MSEQPILMDTHENIALIRLNRPQALNALNVALIDALNDALNECETDKDIRCIVLAGNETAFAAGADIHEMHHKTYPDTYLEDFIKKWEIVSQIRKPIIAAVSGYVLGGGCEIAMMCDMIFASETAQFGQPEIKLGIMPGAGGSQRLARWIGKSKAMDMCLTGRMMSAQEAERVGLVSRIFSVSDLLPEAVKVAQSIANMSQPAVLMIKESINRAFETSLSEGVRFERRMFQSTFAMEDQKEGMAAFLEKRPPHFQHR